MSANRFAEPGSASGRLYEQARRVIPGGTFSGNPVGMTAGLASMQALDTATYVRLDALGAVLRARLEETLRRRRVPGVVTGDASLSKFVMTAETPRTYRHTVDRAAEARMPRLFVHLLDEGVLVNGNGLACLSTPMGEREADEIVEATDRATARLATEGV